MSITLDEKLELERLRKENAALRQDAERYRFLHRRFFPPYEKDIDGNHTWRWEFHPVLRGPSLDAAIDAAMREQALQALAEQAQELGLGYEK